jgi:hypothetical protein
MTKMPTKAPLSSVALAGVFVFALVFWPAVESPPVDAQLLMNTTNITFTAWGENLHGFALEDRKSVQRLLSTIHLERKERCLCAHRLGAIFKGPSGQVEISFCDHCFNVVDGNHSRYYKMPKAFYAEFYAQARAETQP